MQDNMKPCVLFLFFSQGHVRVVQFLVKEVNQFPSDIECMRYIATITDKVSAKKTPVCLQMKGGWETLATSDFKGS